MRTRVYALLCAVFVSAAICAQVTIDNAHPRRDTSGDIMDVHDGNTIFMNGLYHYYGASYGNCTEPAGQNGCAAAGVGNCGFQLNHNVSLFTSPDLGTWTKKGPVFEMANFPRDEGILFCPKVLYNAARQQYVMWFNWIAKAGFKYSYYAVAVSATAEGPFKVVTPKVTTLAWEDTGDFSLFQDDDGTAYIVYTAHIQDFSSTHLMSVERLTPDYLSTLGKTANSGFFGETFVEAPAMFKRNDVYYVLFGQCCCYCGQGSSVTAYTSKSPLGPYVTKNNLSSKIPAQQTNVLVVKGVNQTSFLWQGDRWQSAPDRIKGHDLSYWGAMTFNADGTIQPLDFLSNFTLNV